MIEQILLKNILTPKGMYMIINYDTTLNIQHNCLKLKLTYPMVLNTLKKLEDYNLLTFMKNGRDCFIIFTEKGTKIKNNINCMIKTLKEC
jgi:DNA-binding MarR family transcriptional regulator